MNNIASGNFVSFCYCGNFYVLILLFFLGIDGSTSLHRAVYKGNENMVRLLLEYGAYVNAQDSYNRAPVHWSVVNRGTSCLKVNFLI